jgi:hypothetical protein
LGQVQSPNDSSLVAQCRRDDVRLKVAGSLQTRQVTMQHLRTGFSDAEQQVPMLHHPAADDDPLRRQDSRDGRQGLPEINRLQSPSFILWWQRLWSPETEPHGITAGQTFQAIFMKRTDARPGVARSTRQEHMAHLRMQESM